MYLNIKASIYEPGVFDTWQISVFRMATSSISSFSSTSDILDESSFSVVVPRTVAEMRADGVQPLFHSHHSTSSRSRLSPVIDKRPASKKRKKEHIGTGTGTDNRTNANPQNSPSSRRITSNTSYASGTLTDQQIQNSDLSDGDEELMRDLNTIASDFDHTVDETAAVFSADGINASNSDPLAYDQPEAVSVLSDTHDWGKEHKDDQWCFLCENGNDPNIDGDNEYFRLLTNMMSNSSTLSPWQQCLNVQKYYNLNFRRHHNNRRWTLKSIHRHQIEHMGDSINKMRFETVRTYYSLMQIFRDSNLCLLDRQTGKKFINMKALQAFVPLTRELLKGLNELDKAR
jgi:hypothetical protein